ncbi:MAG: hypothetical protein WAK03_01115 [Methylocystis sp.]|jgi:hypothetical protein
MQRITLVDVDRPDEPLEAETAHVSETALRLVVPNTAVEFELRRSDPNGPYEGSLGGRDYVFDPGARPSAAPINKPRRPQQASRRA